MNHFTDTDLALWLDAVKAVPHHNVDGLLDWMAGPLQKFFPFERCFLVHGELTAGEIRMTHWLSCRHEERYLQQMASSFELSQRGSLRWWLQNQQPFGIDPEDPPIFATAFEVEELRSFGLGRIAAHGVVNIKANAGTYFSFTGIPRSLSGWHLDALRLIAPVLNDLFLAHARASQQQKQKPTLEELTPRQREIVRQLADGLEDKAIAKNVGIAEKTVRNQLAAIYAKTGIRTRAHLIAFLR
jgi:DNA-binding CsgD family transcriptional regulator